MTVKIPKNLIMKNLLRTQRGRRTARAPGAASLGRLGTVKLGLLGRQLFLAIALLAFCSSSFISSTTAQPNATPGSDSESSPANSPVIAPAPAPTATDVPEPVPVEPQPVLPNSDDACLVTGCSGEICVNNGTDAPIETICLWKPEFACYSSSAAGWNAELNDTIIATGDSGEKALAYCGMTNGKCAWRQSPQLKACLAYFASLGSDEPTPTFTESPAGPKPTSIDGGIDKSNFTCRRWGCLDDLCTIKYAGEPEIAISCMPPTNEQVKAYEWTKCFEASDCQAVVLGQSTPGSSGSGDSGSSSFGGATAQDGGTVTAVTAQPGPAATPSKLEKPARRAILAGRQEVSTEYGCAWNSTARPGLLDCLKRNNWPGLATATMVPLPPDATAVPAVMSVTGSIKASATDVKEGATGTAGANNQVATTVATTTVRPSAAGKTRWAGALVGFVLMFIIAVLL